MHDPQLLTKQIDEYLNVEAHKKYAKIEKDRAYSEMNTKLYKNSNMSILRRKLS